MSDEEPAQEAGPQPADPLFQELAALYDNPEVFSDPSIPLLPRFRVLSRHIPNTPTVLTIEINDYLLHALREAMFQMMREMTPDFEEKMIADYDAKDWDDAKIKIINELALNVFRKPSHCFLTSRATVRTGTLKVGE